MLASLFGRKDKVALTLIEAIKQNLAIGVGHLVIDVEGAARLNLQKRSLVLYFR